MIGKLWLLPRILVNSVYVHCSTYASNTSGAMKKVLFTTPTRCYEKCIVYNTNLLVCSLLSIDMVPSTAYPGFSLDAIILHVEGVVGPFNHVHISSKNVIGLRRSIIRKYVRPNVVNTFWSNIVFHEEHLGPLRLDMNRNR